MWFSKRSKEREVGSGDLPAAAPSWPEDATADVSSPALAANVLHGVVAMTGHSVRVLDGTTAEVLDLDWSTTRLNITVSAQPLRYTATIESTWDLSEDDYRHTTAFTAAWNARFTTGIRARIKEDDKRGAYLVGEAAMIAPVGATINQLHAWSLRILSEGRQFDTAIADQLRVSAQGQSTPHLNDDALVLASNGPRTLEEITQTFHSLVVPGNPHGLIPGPADTVTPVSVAEAFAEITGIEPQIRHTETPDAGVVELSWNGDYVDVFVDPGLLRTSLQSGLGDPDQAIVDRLLAVVDHRNSSDPGAIVTVKNASEQQRADGSQLELHVMVYSPTDAGLTPGQTKALVPVNCAIAHAVNEAIFSDMRG